MLDDLKFIHQRDASDAFGVAEKQWQQLAYEFDVPVAVSDVHNVVVAGMGGSALAATFINTWPRLTVPYEVVRDYNTPPYVNANTLFIASSYSGNTEETVAAAEEARIKGAQIAIISSGGKLADFARQHEYPLFMLPAGYQPRMAVFNNFSALIQFFEAAGLVDEGSFTRLKVVAQTLKQYSEDLRPDVPIKQNQAKRIALELVGKSPVIYAGPLLYPAAYKWKINFNENAKNVAWCNQLPEFNHNEFLGWSSHPIDKPYAPIYLQSSFDQPHITKRFEVSQKLLSGRMPMPISVHATGESLLEQLLGIILVGDFVSLYLAMLNNIDPTPVDLIEKLKKELAK